MLVGRLSPSPHELVYTSTELVELDPKTLIVENTNDRAYKSAGYGMDMFFKANNSRLRTKIQPRERDLLTQKNLGFFISFLHKKIYAFFWFLFLL